MSTRSYIYVKVDRREKKGKITFDEKKLPIRLEDWGFDSCSDKCEPIELKDKYIGIYCHSSGFPEDLGKSLLLNFNDYDSVINLIAGGSCSYIGDSSVLHYANRNGEYWKYIKPFQRNRVGTECDGIDYIYVFKDGYWNVGTCKYHKLKEGGYKTTIKYETLKVKLHKIEVEERMSGLNVK